MLVPYVGELPEKTTFKTFRDYLAAQPDRKRADIIGKANAANPVLYRRGLEKRGLDPDNPGVARRIPEGLIILQKKLENGGEKGIFNSMDTNSMAEPPLNAPPMDDWNPPRFDAKDDAMIPLVLESDAEKILEKALQDDGQRVIFKNEAAIANLGALVEANPERLAATLRQYETAIKECTTHEIGVVVRRDGELVGVVRGGDRSVNIPPEWVKGCVVTHNHPKGSNFLSVGDVLQIIDDDGFSVRNVTQHNGGMSIAKGSSELPWSDELRKKLESIKGDFSFFKAVGVWAQKTGYKGAHPAREFMRELLGSGEKRYGYKYKWEGL